MATSVFMPKAGMMMEKGRVVQWFKKEGDSIRAEEPLLEIETDKAILEIEAPASGILLAILHPAGTVTPVSEILAWIGRPGEKMGAGAGSVTRKKRSGTPPSAAAVMEVPSKPVGNNNGRIAATPLAKTLAAKRGIDLRKIRPSGPNGEIRACDVTNSPANS